MNRALLRNLLSAFPGEAGPTFVAVLDDPGADFDPDAVQRCNSTANLLTIYSHRAEHVRAVGLRVLGFDETVQNLEATSHDSLVGVLGAAQSGYPSCVAFLTPDLSSVVAAVAVLEPLPQG